MLKNCPNDFWVFWAVYDGPTELDSLEIESSQEDAE